ncbi:hypothetical protein NCLIV_048660 [Neospora caninum Liverpool]|uniref:ubiquitinyl hydrolase 1 n=1 Tax=Neospora caninum (strain Liverpool) TaxID=572307 RepID=F0VK36_NEOCL|nr:hypothetical protein NCLIV_048660 [Neospora caninum Liverpool]CBZ54437.1 hypothetical protein NCLIV_048660 [Neospora caninum Liverpool]CEL69146.1 TPA: hypothetical protein BN1204_048660 [Neospora caninum Liverpool]|eukprot:XP_003884467.1 hypothetical protein NCLIV_048660 [Neospora caninum Liverpool]
MASPPCVCNSNGKLPLPRIIHVYHERQSLLQCARHTVNNILQAPAYSSADFERLAGALDRGEFFPVEKLEQQIPRGPPATAHAKGKRSELRPPRRRGAWAGQSIFAGGPEACSEGASIPVNERETASRDGFCGETKTHEQAGWQVRGQTGEDKHQTYSGHSMPQEGDPGKRSCHGNGAAVSEQDRICTLTRQASPGSPDSSSQSPHAHRGKEPCSSSGLPLRESSDSSSTSFYTPEQEAGDSWPPSSPNASTPVAPAHLSRNTNFGPIILKRTDVPSRATAPLSCSPLSCATAMPVFLRPVPPRPVASPLFPEEGSRGNLFSALFATNYSAPFCLGNYDLSLVQLLLGRHGLELDFRNERRAQGRSGRTVSAKGVPTKGSSLTHENTRNSCCPVFPGAVTLEQLRNPRLVGFIINVELPKTGWRRLLPKSASRHFYAIRKLSCTYTLEPRSCGTGGKFGSANEMATGKRAEKNTVLLLDVPERDPQNEDWGTSESQTEKPPATRVHCGEAPHDCPCGSLSFIQYTTSEDRHDAASRFHSETERRVSSSQKAAAAGHAHSESGYCWVNLDSKLERPYVFVDDRALVLYLNKKLGERYGVSMQGSTQAMPRVSPEDKKRCLQMFEEGCVCSTTPRADSQYQECDESTVGDLGGKRFEADAKGGRSPETRSAPATVHKVPHEPLRLYMPRRYGDENSATESSNVDDDYKDAVVIEVVLATDENG